jgi:LemA protein
VAEALYIILALLLLGLLVLSALVVMIYNALIRGRILIREAFSGIDVQLKRRHDLIPNLVSTVQGYAQHERGVLEQVTRLRTQAMGDVTISEKQQDERRLSGALKLLLAIAENYPALQANTNFLNLQQQLAAIEDDLQKARRYYNGTVRDYNTQIEAFPSNIVASIFAFERAEFFELERVEEAAIPSVELKANQ